jgi:hypothetical protein
VRALDIATVVCTEERWTKLGAMALRHQGESPKEASAGDILEAVRKSYPRPPSVLTDWTVCGPCAVDALVPSNAR